MDFQRLIKINLFLNFGLAMSSTFLSWLLFGTPITSLQIGGINIEAYYNSLMNTLESNSIISLFAVPVSVVFSFINIIFNILTANYSVFAALHIADSPFFYLYASFHYLSLIVFLFYTFTNKTTSIEV